MVLYRNFPPLVNFKMYGCMDVWMYGCMDVLERAGNVLGCFAWCYFFKREIGGALV